MACCDTEMKGAAQRGGRNDDSPYASGQRKTPSPPKNLSTPHGQEIHLQKKREYNEESPPRLYIVTEQNDDVTDGILGGRLLRIELWNMK